MNGSFQHILRLVTCEDPITVNLSGEKHGCRKLRAPAKQNIARRLLFVGLLPMTQHMLSTAYLPFTCHNLL